MASSIVKRLIQEIDDEDISASEDLPIEYYEMRELAKKRVIMRSAFRTHLIIFFLVNSFLITVNYFEQDIPITTFNDLWSVWVLSIWGLPLWSHFWSIKTQTITDDRQRIFILTFFMNVYLASFFISLNYFGTRYINDSSDLWWPWAVGFQLVFTLINAYFTFVKTNDAQLDEQVEEELIKMKGEFEFQLRLIQKMEEKTALRIQKEKTALTEEANEEPGEIDPTSKEKLQK